jgi:hypothetical protein
VNGAPIAAGIVREFERALKVSNRGQSLLHGSKVLGRRRGASSVQKLSAL